MCLGCQEAICEANPAVRQERDGDDAKLATASGSDETSDAEWQRIDAAWHNILPFVDASIDRYVQGGGRADSHAIRRLSMQWHASHLTGGIGKPCWAAGVRH